MIESDAGMARAACQSLRDAVDAEVPAVFEALAPLDLEMDMPSADEFAHVLGPRRLSEDEPGNGRRRPDDWRVAARSEGVRPQEAISRSRFSRWRRSVSLVTRPRAR